jgi:polyisoprenoid-binding protein YceI
MRAPILSLAFLLSACASAPGAADVSEPPSASSAVAASEAYPASVDLPAGVYRLDPRHASVQFRIRHMSVGYFVARFDTKDATLTLDPDDPTRSQLTATIDPMSVNTGVLNAAGERNFDQSMGRALGGEPMTFTSTRIERTGRFTANVIGDLSINGVTRPATFAVTYHGGRTDPLRGGGMALGFEGRATITRSQWGVTQWAAFAADDVEIVIEAEFVRQGS